MENYRIIGIRENSGFLERGIDYFSSKWDIERRIYADCIGNSISTESALPRWYLMLDEEKIIGSYGIITNDFISRQDLFPWICALYVEEEYRGKSLGAKLLGHARKEAGKAGFKKIYLATDINGYYEKFGWKKIATGFHPRGEESSIYEIHTI